jgi:hypothetical protein
MLSTTTGGAHSLLVDWFRAGESIKSVFHLLSLNFYCRITINEAKVRLQNYKCPKTDSLAKCESDILTLATRASDICAGLGSQCCDVVLVKGRINLGKPQGVGISEWETDGERRGGDQFTRAPSTVSTVSAKKKRAFFENYSVFQIQANECP